METFIFIGSICCSKRCKVMIMSIVSCHLASLASKLGVVMAV